MDRLQGSGRTPLRVYGPQPTYQTYISPYGPKYVPHTPYLPTSTPSPFPPSHLPMLLATDKPTRTKHIPNLMGISLPKAIRYGGVAAGFGVAAGTFALFFFGEVPKVRKDILQKVSGIGEYFVREIPPEDNPF